ncbi:MAG TPA: hypothetical protein VNO32_50505 [Candidatus Acidoferrum sp.]|nr:hypothetical protein [Candidatus Acidoferrum sp.]
MKQKDDWRNKLDPWALQFLEGYRKASAVRGSVDDPVKWHEKMEEIASKHPQIRELVKVEVLPEFIERLLQNEELAKHISVLNPSPGTKTTSPPVATFIDVAQKVTLALDQPELRIAAGFAAGFVAVMFGNLYSDISKMYFGDAGPKADDLMWTVGKTLEVMGKALRTGKAPDVKGKVNVELLKLIKVLRKHEKVKLTYRELREAIAYAGVHVEDEDALRQFIFRAKKKGWLRDDEES